MEITTMSTNEQRIREFAYQIWESEGKPHGQTERHWSMACKLAQTHADSDVQAANDDQQTGSTEPIEPISPTQPAQPVTPSDPIQPTDPVTPSQPIQPGSPTALLATGNATTTKKSRAKDVEIGDVIARATANEKAAAKKKSAGQGDLNTDVKLKTDLRKKSEAKPKADAKAKPDATAPEAKKVTKPKKSKSTEDTPV
jgi:hypothetical protein